MRFWDYVARFAPAAQVALVNDLTLGYGRIDLAIRLHDGSPRTAEVLATLAWADAALRAAQATLDQEETDDGAADAWAAAGEGLPPAWRALVSGLTAGVVGALLAMASEMARDAVAATVADAEVATVRTLVRDARRMLAHVRQDLRTAA